MHHCQGNPSAGRRCCCCCWALLLLRVQVQRSLPQLAAKVEALEAQRQAVVIEEEEQVGPRGGGEGGEGREYREYTEYREYGEYREYQS